MRKYIAILLLLYSFMISAFASDLLTPEEKQWLTLHPKIVFGIEKSWAPMIIRNKDGSLSGIDADTVAFLNRTLGTHITFKVGKWTELIKELKKHEIDGLSSASTNPKHSQYANFTQSYNTIIKSLFVKKRKP